jgi:hypothetical protein
MPKNILIFADGTANVGGLIPDENRTNVYKLYRATRIGPDTNIDPRRQIAFYVRGVGTSGSVAPWWPIRLWNTVAQAVGYGLSKQVADCYMAIISVWQPGDRIYLFGFSRGAYAARCLAHVLEQIGIPTTEQDGCTPISLVPASLQKVARKAVKTIYKFGLPVADEAIRSRRSGFFATNHRCSSVTEPTCAVPYAICLWDSVGAMGWTHIAAFSVLKLLPFLKSDHDKHFTKDTPFARHAMAIDEYRRDFQRVKWGGSGTVSDDDIDGVDRFQQRWFVGNHGDVGGNYPENESRLSDISLQWISNFISREIPDDERRIQIDERFLHCSPSSDGMMHDEMMVGHTPANIHIWGKPVARPVEQTGSLHPTVLERFALPPVRNFSGYGKYLPVSLKDHPKVKAFYQSTGDPSSDLDMVSTRSGPHE